jgi:hypothetical protein
MSMFMALVAPFVTNVIYFAVGENVSIAKETAWLLTGSLSGAWAVFFVAFLWLMNREYIRTFFSAETGNEWAMDFFLKGDDDAQRVKTIRLNPNKWKKIRPLVKDFVLENWKVWEEDQPDWFTKEWKAKLPDDMLPAAELMKQKLAGGGERRRSSLGELVGLDVSVRERRSSATIVPLNETAEGGASEEAAERESGEAEEKVEGGDDSANNNNPMEDLD